MRLSFCAAFWICTVLLCATPAWAQHRIPWAGDLDGALEQAQQQNRLVLLHFWTENCPPCAQLERNVLNRPEVIRAVSAHYIPVKVNARDAVHLARRYGVDRWPTDVIVTPDGTMIIKQVSNQDPNRYIAFLDQTAAHASVAMHPPGGHLPLATVASATENAYNQLPAQQARFAAAGPYSDPYRPQTSPAGESPAAAANGTLPSGSSNQASEPARQHNRHFDRATAGTGPQTTWPYESQPSVPAFGNGAPSQQPSPRAEAAYGYPSGPGAASQAPAYGYRPDAAQAPAGNSPFAAGPQLGTPTGSPQLPPAARSANPATPADQSASRSTPAEQPEQLDAPRGHRGYTPSDSTFQGDFGPPGSRHTAPPADSSFGAGRNSQPPTYQPQQRAPAETPGAPAWQPGQPGSGPAQPAYPPQMQQPSARGGFGPQGPVAGPPELPARQPQLGAPTQGARPEAPAAAGQAQIPPGNPPLALDGWCPVTLVERWDWKRGDARWGAIHKGRTYLFAGAVEQQKFLADPDRYAPLFAGYDPVLASRDGQWIEGRRAYGVMFRDRMVLFSSEQTLAEFERSPDQFLNRVYQAMRSGTAPAHLR